jgi:hypothetical protein
VADYLIYPDAEDLICGYLAGELSARGHDVPVGTRPPEPRPAEGFLVVRRTGGVAHTPVTDAALLAVEAWADRESLAYELARIARAALTAAPGQLGGATVYLVREAAGPANLPDPVSPLARYTATYEIHFRGAAA